MSNNVATIKLEKIMPKGYFDADAFFEALDKTRNNKKITWRKVAEEAGVSASTLTRMAQGKRPDVDTLAALAAWWHPACGTTPAQRPRARAAPSAPGNALRA